MGRRDDLADAAVRLVARGGARTLTHRGVDAEASVPPGSTTYYASTRHALLALVTSRVTEQLAEDLEGLHVPAEPDESDVVEVATGFLEVLSRRRDSQLARLALLVELRDDAELRAPLTGADPVRTELVAVARTLLDAIDVAAPEQAAMDLVGLVDALLLYRVGAVADVDAGAVLTAYLVGLPRRSGRTASGGR